MAWVRTMVLSASDESFLDRVAFDRLKKVLHEGTNINFECYRESYLKRRLKVRLTATKTKTYPDYVNYLKANPSEFDLLVNDLTINYTKFFRDPDVFLFLQKTILPELFSSKRWVRIWSAGCATGEEAYSLAILVHEVLKHQVKDVQVSIYASDLDRTALAKAKSGEYTSRMVNGVEESILDRYFECDNGVYKVKNEVKQLVHFEEQDLMTPPLRRNLDLILCRNVMIYFSKEIQRKIYMNFYDSLRHGGYLITGKTELIAGEAGTKFVEFNPKCRVYQKSAQATCLEKPKLDFCRKVIQGNS
jgi:chemotaxis protein methyltransferase CheR